MPSIRKRGSSYQITVSNGRDVNGRQLIETTTFVPDPLKTEKQNQKALRLFALEFEKQVHEGKYLSGEQLTYSKYIEMWMKDYAEKQMQQNTIDRTDGIFKGIVLPVLGHLKLSEIRPLHIQKLYDSLMKNGYEKGGKHHEYSPNTIKRIHQAISSSLSTAVYWQLIESNPCQRVKPPKVEKQPDVQHFTLEQAQAFLDFLDVPYMTSTGGRRHRDGSPSKRHYQERTVPLQIKVFFYLALFGGFRRGELLALTWDDINYAEHTIEISKAVAVTKQGVFTKSPKNYTSNRTVTMPPVCMEQLKKLEIYQKEYRLQLGNRWHGENYVFIQDDGKLIHDSTPNNTLKKIIRRYNEDPTHTEKLPEITLHGLRHTSATLLIAYNTDIKTVSGRLGHANTSTTINIYAHALRKKDEEAADSLSELFKQHG